MKKLLILLLPLYTAAFAQTKDYPFRNADLPLETRVKDLLGRLTLEEKVAMMTYQSKPVERLGVPAYNWWNEALHGVARTKEKVTVFPQAIGLAATFDTKGIERVGDIASSEGRALFNEDLKSGKTGSIYRGLTYWTPNINIFRDPRWGRGQETYGEDPYLTAKIGTAMVRGLEGDDPHYLKAVACAKHFAVHSGPEGIRHSFDARPTPFDLWDTYLPAFRELVTKAKVHGVMCAYNRLDGQPCCGNNPLLTDILRRQWKFDGYVTSDCWAVSDFTSFHKTHPAKIAAVSDALLAGTDLECGNLYPLLVQATKEGWVTERDIDLSMTRLLTILFKLGMFDPASKVPYSSIGRDVLECKAHQEHALRMARESIVLLKNKDKVLPLNPKNIRCMAVVGPNADHPQMQLANYFGTPSEIITPVKSIKNRYSNSFKMITSPGSGMVKQEKDRPTPDELAAQVSEADVIVYIGGISADYEGEAGDAGAGGYSGFASGDRTTIQLPPIQMEQMKALKKLGKPLIVVNMSGSTMDFVWESQEADALLQAWYGGQAAGDALMDVLFGQYNPAGRMPITAYASDNDLPPFEDYSMRNRTYRYFKGTPTYPFGFGLSYTNFGYSRLRCASHAHTGTDVEVEVTVRNKGKVDGDEVVQLYVSHEQNGQDIIPIRSLKGFKRIHLKRGKSTRVTFKLSPEELALTDAEGNWVERPGKVTLFVGGGQPGSATGQTATLQLQGDAYKIP